MKRIGLFGGTFNPIHRGHLRAADQVRQQFPLDQIYFIPSATPPHKEPEMLAEATHRLAMIRLAIAERPYFNVSDVEIARPGPSFTIDTVRDCRINRPAGTDLYLLMGVDAFLEIHTWKAYHALLKSIDFIVMSRPSAEFTQVREGWRLIEDYLNRMISEHYHFSPEIGCWDHPENRSIHLQDIGLADISSTEIRSRIRSGLSIASLVPAAVNAYIKTKGLYR